MQSCLSTPLLIHVIIQKLKKVLWHCSCNYENSSPVINKTQINEKLRRQIVLILKEKWLFRWTVIYNVIGRLRVYPWVIGNMGEPPKLLKDPTHVHQVNADFACYNKPQLLFSLCTHDVKLDINNAARHLKERKSSCRMIV